MTFLAILMKAVSCSEVLVALTTFLITWYLLQQRKRDRLTLPGPFAWPIIGNGMELGSNPQLFFSHMAERYGSIYQMKLGSVAVVVLNKRDIIRNALIRQKSTFSGRPIFQSFENISLGKGVAFNSVLSQGEQWKKNKKAILSHVHSFATTVNTRPRFAMHISREIGELIHEITKASGQSNNGFVQNPQPMVTVSVANVICALVFGKRYNYDNQEFLDLVSLNKQFGEVVGAGSQIDVMPWIKKIPYFKKKADTFRFLNDRTENWARKRIAEHDRDYKPGVVRDIVDSMTSSVNTQGVLNDVDKEQILALTIDIFGATQDTMSSAIQWILLYLTKFPEYQRKIRDEIEKDTGGKQEVPEMRTRYDFPICESFIHEVFRHSSFVARTIPHYSLEDTELGGYHIPKHTVLFINQYMMNHDPDEWDQPDEFIPERFLDDSGNMMTGKLDRYMIFSVGERMCPGKELATSWIRYFTTVFVYLCEIEDDPEHPSTLEGRGNLSSRPINLSLRLRVLKPNLLEKIRNSDDDMMVLSGQMQTGTESNGDNPETMKRKHVSHTGNDVTFESQGTDSANSIGDDSAGDLEAATDAVNNNKNIDVTGLLNYELMMNGNVGKMNLAHSRKLDPPTLSLKTPATRDVVEIVDGSEFYSSAISRLNTGKLGCAISNPL